MDYKEYQPLAQRTSSTMDLMDKRHNAALGLIGQTGEVVDMVKKIRFQGKTKEQAVQKLVSEIGDVIWYCAELCAGYETDLDTVNNHYAVSFVDDRTEYDLNDVQRDAVFMSRNACSVYIGVMSNKKHFHSEQRMSMISVYDILGCCDAILRMYCGINIQEAMDRNINKLKLRYPDGFDASRSNNRAPGDQ